jgi:hypothetical protein
MAAGMEQGPGIVAELQARFPRGFRTDPQKRVLMLCDILPRFQVASEISRIWPGPTNISHHSIKTCLELSLRGQQWIARAKTGGPRTINDDEVAPGKSSLPTSHNY